VEEEEVVEEEALPLKLKKDQHLKDSKHLI
jgi:hypothetical protein